MHLHHFLSFIFSLLTLNSSLQHQQHQQQGKTKGRLYMRIFCTIAYFRQNSQQLIVKKEEREREKGKMDELLWQFWMDFTFTILHSTSWFSAWRLSLKSCCNVCSSKEENVLVFPSSCSIPRNGIRFFRQDKFEWDGTESGYVTIKRDNQSNSFIHNMT